VRERAARAVRELERRFGDATVAVVTHLGWLRCLRPGLELANAEAICLEGAALREASLAAAQDGLAQGGAL
jgi:broad specificity phosphatase PhoE